MTLSLNTSNNANYCNNNVVLNPLEMCRVCLSDKFQVYTDVMGPNEPHLVQYVSEYYKVEITSNDEGKSTKLCQRCIEFIDIWRGHVKQAQASQVVVNYLAEKTYMSSAPAPQTVTKRSLFVPNKKKKIASKRSKRKKTSSSLTEYEIPSSSSSSTSSIDMIQSPSESIEQSTSASIEQFPSTDIEPMQYESDFPTTSNSKEIVPFESTSTEIIPLTLTSTESIPSASTSTETIPFESTLTEIIPPFTTGEVLPTEGTPTWYSMDTDHEGSSKMFAMSSSFKAEFICIFCTYQNEEVSRNVYKHILFCSKHSKPYACIFEGCHSVFPNKEVFITHYRNHLNINSSICVCHKCFGVLTCSMRSIPFDHVHQNVLDLLKCCSLTFPSMVKLVLHKLINHRAVVITNTKYSRILQKPNLNIKKIEPNDLKVGLDVPDNVPRSEIIKDNGSIKCNYCPHYFTTVIEYINHSLIKHRLSIKLKEKGIKLCPMCESSYLNEQFSQHIETCTNTLRVGISSMKSFGCIHCKFIFTDITTREFRNHVLYCKSFKLGIVNNKLHQKCNNCTFTSTDDDECMAHANSNCLYFQLKMRYAMGPDEKAKVEERVKFNIQNTQQGENVNENDEELASSKLVCNTARQKLLQFYNFYCNNCKQHFFDITVFFKHLTVTGSYCRSQTLIYCQKCLTEFETVEDYRRHLPSMPEASPLLSIKQEISDQNNDDYSDIHVDVVRENHNIYHVKVEMNNETFIHKQEPQEPAHFYETSNMQYQEQDQDQEQVLEQEQGLEQEQVLEQEQEQDQVQVQEQVLQVQEQVLQVQDQVLLVQEQVLLVQEQVLQVQEQDQVHEQVQEENQVQEQEQEDSNVDFNNSFACQEMELTNSDIYMQCEVEDKPDLNQLLMENVE